MNYDDQQMNSYLEILLHDEQFSTGGLLPDFAELTPAFGGQQQQQQQQQQENIPPAFQELTNLNYYDAPSPPLSTVSNSSTVFTFPTPAPTPEAALPLAESLVETPNIDISLFGPNSLFNSDKKDMGVYGTVNIIPAETPKVQVKEELATHIRQRRRASGLPEEVTVSDDEAQAPKNELTKADMMRRERRKASNRRAATKCRLKKKAADDLMQQAMQRLRDENSDLRKEVESLNSSKRELEERLNGHLAVCPHHQR